MSMTNDSRLASKEDELLGEIKKLLDKEKQLFNKNIKRVVTKLIFPLGELANIAIERGYTEKIGIKAYFKLHFGKSYETIRKARKVYLWGIPMFFNALAAYENLNSDWQPKHKWGADFALEVIAAYYTHGFSIMKRVTREPSKQELIHQRDRLLNELAYVAPDSTVLREIRMEIEMRRRFPYTTYSKPNPISEHSYRQ